MTIIQLWFKALYPPLVASPTAIHRIRASESFQGAGVDRGAWLAEMPHLLRGPMAEWLRRGLQILARRFDSGSGLHSLGGD